MITYNILKPDILGKDNEEIEYLNRIKSELHVVPKSIYKIPNWPEFSKSIYEEEILNEGFNNESLQLRRKQLLVNAIAYDQIFKDLYARLLLFEIDGNYEELKEKLKVFNIIKKEFRKKYVYNQKKYYVKFKTDREIKYDMPLYMKDYSFIVPEIKVLEHNQELNEDGYELAFFNKIHCPDPIIEYIDYELDLMKKQGIIKPKNLIMSRR